MKMYIFDKVVDFSVNIKLSVSINRVWQGFISWQVKEFIEAR